MASEDDDDLRTTRGVLETGPGHRIGRFTLISQLNAGGQAVAWLAEDPNRRSSISAGTVVLKFLPQEIRDEPERFADQLAEFRSAYLAAQAIHHEAICPLYDLEHDPQCGYFQVMQYVPGITLREALQQHASGTTCFSIEQIAQILEPIARALDCVHDDAVAHGDVKPENVIWDPDRTKVHLIDFGAAVTVREPRQRTPDGQIATSTAPYRSPELWQGWQTAPSDDHWAFAVMAFELLTGKRPFGNTAAGSLAEQIQRGQPDTSLASSLRPQVLQVFQQAFHRDLSGRFQRCTLFLQQLLAAVQQPLQPTDPQVPRLQFPSFPDQSSRLQADVAQTLQLPQSLHVGGTTLVLLPPGHFQFGTPHTPEHHARQLAPWQPDLQALRRELPATEQLIPAPLYFATTPVTVAQFAGFLQQTGYQPESFRDGHGGWGFDTANQNFHGPDPKFSWQHTGWKQTPDDPVVNVSWNDAQAYASALQTQYTEQHSLPLRFRLPTEIEWEYACRAGSDADFWFGSQTAELGNYANVSDATKRQTWTTWPGLATASGIKFTAPVTHLPPNPFGLHDMHGNVRQWCTDRLTHHADPRFPGIACFPIRGGAWCNSPVHARCSARDLRPPSHRDDHIGIRVVAELIHPEH
jgi:formylglycine-generating enzyme required for sulfatase activity